MDKELISKAYQTLRQQEPWNHSKSNLLHHRILPFATLASWLNDKDFEILYKKIKNHTLVDIYRCYELYQLAKQVEHLEGDILEVGVWRGGTGSILAEAVKNTDKKVYLADTFIGVVKATKNDTSYEGGEHADTSVEIVADLLNSLSISNVEILQGIFPDDTKDKIKGKISLLHCDVDVYSSSKDIIEWAIPRLSIGSIIVFDDYGFYGCEGVAKYCEELRKNKDFIFIYNLNGHAIFIKIK